MERTDVKTSRKTTVTIELEEAEAKKLGRAIYRMQILAKTLPASTINEEDIAIVRKFEYMLANS